MSVSSSSARKSVCEPVCWNKNAGLCESCEPDLGEETSAVQAQVARARVVIKPTRLTHLGLSASALASVTQRFSCNV